MKIAITFLENFVRRLLRIKLPWNEMKKSKLQSENKILTELYYKDMLMI